MRVEGDGRNFCRDVTDLMLSSSNEMCLTLMYFCSTFVNYCYDILNGM